MMSKLFAAIVIGAVAAFSSSAVVNESKTAELTDVESSYNFQPGDEYMPTLTELLGGPVDNLPEFTDEAILSGQIIDYAKQFIGTRYRSGAKGPSAFDCSGFTSYVFGKFDYSLASSSRGQATQGERINLTDAKPGDLMFFSGRGNRKSVGHVGIVVDVDHETGKVKFIHAATSKGVSIDTYPDGGYYSKRFLHIQRVLPV
ncbi:MAG: C40 family peptidase [Paramuribaculum sp.]|nr:C40 family peptidase [Bacteroides sp.]MDE6825572.1 C40 family peptidase [Paramuribaculum sp.]